MKLLRNKKLVYFFLIFFFLLLLKIDYRLIESINCCQDDHDYFMHAETISVDFDLDYSNQLEGFETKRFNNNGKIAPKGFIGTGLLSAPFLFIGNLLNNLIPNANLMNLGILFYSFASIFYLFLSIFLLRSILKENNYNEKTFFIFLWIFGSGLPYFAFERYSMTHVFEVFTILLVMNYSNKYCMDKNQNNIYPIFIALSMFLGILVKWTNYYIFILPLFVKLIFKEQVNNEKKLTKNKFFISSGLFFIFLFCYLSYEIYGKVTFNPQFVYGTSNLLGGFVSSEGNLINFLLINIKNFFIILFTKEFGIFWFSAIIFSGLLINVILIFIDKNRGAFFVSLFVYAQTFGVVLMWKSTASSYGFRYLYNLVPLSIILFVYFKDKYQYKFVEYYLSIFSVIGILSLFFFETTEMTQLSEVDQLNSFGRNLRFTEPEYLVGFVYSFLELDSYLKIFTTSFFGLIIFKILFLILGSSTLVSLLGNFGLPVDNPDFVEFIQKVESIEIFKLFFVFIFIFIFSKRLVDYFSLND